MEKYANEEPKMIVEEIITQRTNSIAFSPQAIYTE
jgi:hypothetical protein